jgi:hypothetical protein
MATLALIGFGELWPVLLVTALLAACTAFWIWMLVDCITRERNEGNDRIVWLLVILLAQILGALVYFFVRRPERVRELGR